VVTHSEDRFDIDDRKGLEIVVLTALMTFQDANEANRKPDSNPPLPISNIPLSPSPVAPVVDTVSSDGMPPPTPPKPAPKTGVERIAEMQAIKEGEYNEIIISDEGNVHDYAEFCNRLLQVCVPQIGSLRCCL
jgi:hypothetical protein